MSKIKRAVGAAACAVGITVGAIAMAAPASAAVYEGNYACSDSTTSYGNIDAEFDHNTTTGLLTVSADVSGIITGVNASVSADLFWDDPASLTDVDGDVDTAGFVQLTKTSVSTFPGEPDSVVLTVPDLQNPPNTLEITCDLNP